MYDQGQSGRVSLGQLVDALQEVYVLRHKDGRDLLLDLRSHWRVERRSGVVSPFDFPDL